VKPTPVLPLKIKTVLVDTSDETALIANASANWKNLQALLPKPKKKKKKNQSPTSQKSRLIAKINEEKMPQANVKSDTDDTWLVGSNKKSSTKPKKKETPKKKPTNINITKCLALTWQKTEDMGCPLSRICVVNYSGTSVFDKSMDNARDFLAAAKEVVTLIRDRFVIGYKLKELFGALQTPHSIRYVRDLATYAPLHEGMTEAIPITRLIDLHVTSEMDCSYGEKDIDGIAKGCMLLYKKVNKAWEGGLFEKGMAKHKEGEGRKKA